MAGAARCAGGAAVSGMEPLTPERIFIVTYADECRWRRMIVVAADNADEAKQKVIAGHGRNYKCSFLAVDCRATTPARRWEALMLEHDRLSPMRLVCS